jgi:hypothetical protein
MKCVYHATNLLLAQVFADCLEGNGIPCEIFRQNAVGALGELPEIGPEIWIRRDTDFDRARNLVHQLEGDMRRSAEASPTLCTHCGESSPGGFDICWRCGIAF